jgi:hypothetical protein
MHQLQDVATSPSRRLLRVLLVWLGEVPTDAAGTCVLLISYEPTMVIQIGIAMIPESAQL